MCPGAGSEAGKIGHLSPSSAFSSTQALDESGDVRLRGGRTVSSAESADSNAYLDSSPNYPEIILNLGLPSHMGKQN